MGTGDILLGGNPAMGQHPVQRGVAILLCKLHAKETGISSGRVGLWLVCAFTFFFITAKLDGVVLEQLIRCLHFHSINYYLAEISFFSRAFK